MKWFGWCALAVAALAAVLLSGSAGQEKRAAPRVKWEYKTLTQFDLDKAKGLSQLGEEGWELAAVESEQREPSRVADTKFGGMVTNTTRQARTYYFKRPK